MSKLNLELLKISKWTGIFNIQYTVQKKLQIIKYYDYWAIKKKKINKITKLY